MLRLMLTDVCHVPRLCYDGLSYTMVTVYVNVLSPTAGLGIKGRGAGRKPSQKFAFITACQPHASSLIHELTVLGLHEVQQNIQIS